MNVLLYTPNYYPATRYGGPVRSTHGLAKALVARGHAVDVYTTNVDGTETLDVPLDHPVERDGVRVRYFEVEAPRRLYRAPRMARALREAMRWADCVHINGVFLLPGAQAARAAERASRPYIISPRGMLVRGLIKARSALAKRSWIALMEQRSLARAAAIHVTSEVEGRELRALGMRTGPVELIPNGVDPPRRIDEARRDALWRGAPPGRRVAFVARLDWKKGVELAIAAVRSLHDVHLRLAGPDEGGLRAALERELAASGGDGARVRFVGTLEDEDKWAFLDGADVTLVPSLNENFGIVVAESLAVGTPVVCTDGVGARALVEALDPTSVVRRDCNAISRALAGLLGDDARRARLGAAGRTLVAERYGWDGIAARMADLFAAAVDERSAASMGLRRC